MLTQTMQHTYWVLFLESLRCPRAVEARRACVAGYSCALRGLLQLLPRQMVLRGHEPQYFLPLMSAVNTAGCWGNTVRVK
jgi:hypothetical protein